MNVPVIWRQIDKIKGARIPQRTCLRIAGGSGNWLKISFGKVDSERLTSWRGNTRAVSGKVLRIATGVIGRLKNTS